LTPHQAIRFGSDGLASRPPKRWIVERTFAWISRNRRRQRLRALAGRLPPGSGSAMIRIILLRRLVKPSHGS